MMICPACNYELLPHDEHCENCGAPAYLATASQESDLSHCTYCGARDEQGSNICRTCGLKKNFKTNENLIGTCRNCGVAWRNAWMYCQTCGVARENGLVDTTLPVTISFSPPIHALPSTKPNIRTTPSPGYSSFEWSDTISETPDYIFTHQSLPTTPETKEQALLSESEVVERMYANGEGERSFELYDFFGESDVAAHRRATLLDPLYEASESETPTSAVVYDLHSLKREPTITPAQPQIEPSNEQHFTLDHPSFQGTEDNTTLGITTPEIQVATSAINTLEERSSGEATLPLTSTNTTATPVNKAEKTSRQVPLETVVTEPLAAPQAEAKPGTGRVQTVRVLNSPRTPTPTVDKKLVKIIIVLILLILIFSALIVSGFRIRDLFGATSPQHTTATANMATTALTTATVPTPEQNVQAPEGMVYIPGGTFRMGVENGDSYESPAHEVTLAAFFIDRTEITNAQYAEFLKATQHAAPPDWKNGPLPADLAKRPVTNVSWQDANDYATWAGKRLPTEAEWEYAAKTQDSHRYPWGTTWDAAKANTSESNINHPVDADSYTDAANPRGLLHMSGNVWEWVAGEVTSYKDASLVLAPGKVIRGGAFYAPKERATTTYRGFAPPDKQATGIGFRCVKDVN